MQNTVRCESQITLCRHGSALLKAACFTLARSREVSGQTCIQNIDGTTRTAFWQPHALCSTLNAHSMITCRTSVGAAELERSSYRAAAMDVEPIYCAEQIVVPADLAGVLKAFTKEVIRSQPNNVVEFSAKYFAELAAQASALHVVTPPSRQQLRQAYAQLQDTPSAHLADVSIACQAAGISHDTLQRVVAAGRIDTSRAVSVLEVLLLLLTMSCETFAKTMQGIFEVFGSSRDGCSSTVLPVSDFMALLGHLAAYDSDVSAALQQQVAEALSGQLDADYRGLLTISALADKLA